MVNANIHSMYRPARIPIKIGEVEHISNWISVEKIQIERKITGGGYNVANSRTNKIDF